MSYFKQHVFFCTNKRTDGRASCEDHGAQELCDYLKEKIKAAGLAKPNGVRVNKAGCLDRCGQGPVLVIYPEGTWYRYKNKADIDEIFERQVERGERITRLLI
ncbi:MAG: 2Fe-2S ferredoxin [Cycloclasticus sp. symbiont of Poecilosclerida sp. N]|nr:MAG: 2Fe-2S ferredoxin [Cycloclasticus sp. symbiont of Poecilosclerida sp. N]